MQLFLNQNTGQVRVFQFDIRSDVQTGWGGLVSEQTDTSVEVPVSRIDEIIDDDIDILKIDIEGADTWALMGCEKLIKNKKIKRIYFEENLLQMKQLNIRPGEATSFLKENGYACEIIYQDDTGLKEWVACLLTFFRYQFALRYLLVCHYNDFVY